MREHNLGGLFAWEIDADNGDILNAMHEGLAGKSTPVPPKNHAPTLDLTPELHVVSGATTQLVANATDPEAKPLTYLWQGDSALTLTANNETLVITAPEITKDAVYTVNLTVSDGVNDVTASVIVMVSAPVEENKAPSVAEVTDVVVDENSEVALSVVASDPEGKTLSYSWQVPGHSIVGSGSEVVLTTSEVEQDQRVTGSVSVSDGVNRVEREFSVTVKSTETTPDPGKTTWNANTVYVGGNIVWYNGVQYKARWWTKGAVPSNGGVWQEIIPDDGTVRDWRSDLVYTGGDQVKHNGIKYQARWWTRGQTPGSNAVWRKL